MLYARRKRQEELARREAAGEDLWVADFDANARVRLLHLFDSISGRYDQRLLAIRRLVLAELGLLGLTDRGGTANDLRAAFLEGDVDLVASMIEAAVAQLREERLSSVVKHFSESVQGILAEHRVSFDFIDGQMVPFESREMHVSVVEPTLRLLGGREGWDGVERAYRKALQEIGTDPTDAVTDAGTALQVALEQLGCSGNALGPLGKDARKRGLLAGHDLKLVEWVGADRSQSGDTHNAEPVTRDDAWFAVHVVGALLLRLSGEAPRS